MSSISFKEARQAAETGDEATLKAWLAQRPPFEKVYRAVKIACTEGHAASVRLLLPHTEGFMTDTYCLPMAAYKGYVDVMDVLLEACDLWLNAEATLSQAVRGGHLPAIHRLMLVPAIAPFGPDNIHMAARGGNLECVGWLVPLCSTEQIRGAFGAALWTKKADVAVFLAPHIHFVGDEDDVELVARAANGCSDTVLPLVLPRVDALAVFNFLKIKVEQGVSRAVRYPPHTYTLEADLQRGVTCVAAHVPEAHWRALLNDYPLPLFEELHGRALQLDLDRTLPAEPMMVRRVRL